MAIATPERRNEGFEEQRKMMMSMVRDHLQPQEGRARKDRRVLAGGLERLLALLVKGVKKGPLAVKNNKDQAPQRLIKRRTVRRKVKKRQKEVVMTQPRS